MRLLLLFACLVSAPALSEEIKPQPVVLRALELDGEKIAPGGAVGHVINLKKGGDGYVSVRAAPTTKASERDRLTLGTHVILVAEPDGNRKTPFTSIIYDPDNREGALMDRCGLPEGPPYFEGLYTGPCKSGWVSSRFVEVLAD